MPSTNPPPCVAANAHVHPREYEASATYRAYLFGPLKVYRGDQSLVSTNQNNRKPLLILRWFLLHPNSPISSDELIDTFWPDASLDRGAGGLHVTMHRLRRMLEPDLPKRAKSQFLTLSGGNCYSFDTSDWWTDVDDLELLFELGQRSETEHRYQQACYYYGRVAAYGSLGFAADIDEDGVWGNICRRFEAIYMQALLRLIELHCTHNERESILDYAYQLKRLDPDNKLAARAIVDAHLNSGRMALAKGNLYPIWKNLDQYLEAHPERDMTSISA